MKTAIGEGWMDTVEVWVDGQPVMFESSIRMVDLFALFGRLHWNPVIWRLEIYVR